MLYQFKVSSSGSKLLYLPIVGAFYDGVALIEAKAMGSSFWPVETRKVSGKLTPSNFPNRVKARRSFELKRRALLADDSLTVTERMNALYGVSE